MTASVRILMPAGTRHRHRPAMLGFVRLTETDTETRVRFNPRKALGTRWRCDTCGPHPSATCAHERATLAAWSHRKDT